MQRSEAEDAVLLRALGPEKFEEFRKHERELLITAWRRSALAPLGVEDPGDDAAAILDAERKLAELLGAEPDPESIAHALYSRPADDLLRAALGGAINWYLLRECVTGRHHTQVWRRIAASADDEPVPATQPTTPEEDIIPAPIRRRLVALPHDLRFGELP